MKSKKKLIIIILIVCVVIATVAAVKISNAKEDAAARAEVNKALVGEVVQGTCSGDYLKWELKVTFNNEETCDIDFKRIEDGRFTGEWNDWHTVFEETYKDVPYTLSGGVDGVYLEWDDSEMPKNGAVPFSVTITGTGPMLYCDDFDSDLSLQLD